MNMHLNNCPFECKICHKLACFFPEAFLAHLLPFALFPSSISVPIPNYAQPHEIFMTMAAFAFPHSFIPLVSMEEKLRKLEQREQEYYRRKEYILEKELTLLRERLVKIIDLKDERLLEKIQDLEEDRDNALLKLYYEQEYRLQRAQDTRDSELKRIEQESKESKNSLHNRLRTRLESYVDYYKNPGSNVFDVDSDVHAKHLQLNRKKKKIALALGSSGGVKSSKAKSDQDDEAADPFDDDKYLRHFEDWSQADSTRKAAISSIESREISGDISGSGGSGGSGGATGSVSGGRPVFGFPSGPSKSHNRRVKIESLTNEEIVYDLGMMRRS